LRSASSPRRRASLSIVLAAAAAAGVAVGVVLLNSGSPGRTADTVSWVAGTWGRGSVPVSVAADERALVALEISGPTGVMSGCGVAVEDGGFVATAADGIAGATSIIATTADGRQVVASVIGIDAGSDIALLRVPERLPVPQFDTAADDLEAGGPAMLISLTTQAGQALAQWSIGRVSTADATVDQGTAAGMSGIATTSPKVPTTSGDVLVEPSGAVVGLLDKGGTNSASTTVFIPTWLVLGVTGELASTGTVHHGWLGISGRDASAQSGDVESPGATVVGVNPAGAAVGLLRVGDVIVALNGSPVRSMAELRSNLYVLGPGTPVNLEIQRGGVKTNVELNLTASP
jgi:S1-C subfamily serine protease